MQNTGKRKLKGQLLKLKLTIYSAYSSTLFFKKNQKNYS